MDSNMIRMILRGEKGFTLVEMMVVLVIIAVLIAIGIRAYIGYIGSSKMTKAKGDITTMQAALDSYYAQNQSYPNGAWGQTLQNTLITVGISSYEVNAGFTPSGASPPYNYGNGLASNTYKVYSITSFNSLYMEGIGTTGLSLPATLVSTP
jgi:general secretion pathway protein G